MQAGGEDALFPREQLAHAGVDRGDLEREILDLLNANFGTVEILSAEIEQDLSRLPDDDDGVPLTVVFRGTTGDLVRNRPDGLFELVGGKLSSLHSAMDALPWPLRHKRSMTVA